MALPYIAYGIGAGAFAIYTWYFSDDDPKVETQKTIRMVALALIVLMVIYYLRNRRAPASPPPT